jgi:ParB/RepB/Spo0J family partition protein
MGTPTLPANQATLEQVPIGLIRTATNDRTEFGERELRDLADSIEQDGLIEPIIVRRSGDDFGFELIAGERRLRATKLLGRHFITALVRDDTDDRQASRLMLAENLHRVDLNPIDEARGYASRIERFGLSEAEVAAWANVTPERVRSRVELLALRDDVRALVASKQLGIGHARCMVGLDGNRQTIALRHMNESATPVTIAEFRLVCGRLREHQNQEALAFGDFSWADTEAAAVAAIGQGHSITLECPTKLPKIEMRADDTAGKALARYSASLRSSNDPAEKMAAAVVAHVLSELASANFTKIPGATRQVTADGRHLLTVPLS